MSYTIPFNKPFMVGKELDYIAQSVESGHTAGDGTFTKRCQALMQERFAAPSVQLTTSCTTALEMAAILCSIEEGDEVSPVHLPSIVVQHTHAVLVVEIVVAVHDAGNPEAEDECVLVV